MDYLLFGQVEHDLYLPDRQVPLRPLCPVSMREGVWFHSVCVPFMSPLLRSLRSRCPAAAVLGDDVNVWVVALVLCLQAGQAGRRRHAPAASNFAQTLEPMSGSHCGHGRNR